MYKKVFIIAAVLAIMVLMAGCGGDKTGINADAKTPASALDGGLSAFMALDAEAIDRFFVEGSAAILADMNNNPQFGDSAAKFYKAMLANLSWDIKREDINESEGTAIVNVDITNVSVSQAMQRAMAAMQSQMDKAKDASAAEQLYFDAVVDELDDAQRVTINVDVKMVKDNNRWKIDENNLDFATAVRGGY